MDSDSDCEDGFNHVITISSNERSSVQKIEDLSGVYILKRYFKRSLRRDLLRKSYKNGMKTEIDLLKNEIENLKFLRHESIIKLLEVTETSTSIDLVLEYGGIPIQDDKLQNCKHFSFVQLKSIMIQLVIVVNFLHSNNVIHCDIKPANILISSSNVKLCDFGSSIRLTPESDILEASPKTTPSFTAPEQYRYSHRDKFDTNVILHGKPLDIWALGVTFFCLVYEKHPFRIDGNIMQLYESIEKYNVDFAELNEDFGPRIIKLIKRLMEKDPEKRVKVEELLLLTNQC